MPDEKEALIDALFNQLVANSKAREQFKKEFKVDDKTFKKMVKKFLDTWLDNPEMVMFLSEMMAMYNSSAPAGDEDAGYYG